MYGLDSNARREAQGIRVCAGIVLLLITMLLTKLQDEAAVARAPSKQPLNMSKWAHTVPECAPGSSQIVYFSTWPDTVLIWYQSLQREADHEQLDLTGYEALDGRSFSYLQFHGLNDTEPVADSLLPNFRGKITPMRESTRCSKSVCYALLTRSAGCSASNFETFMQSSTCATATDYCYKVYMQETLESKDLSESNLITSAICDDVQPTTFQADKYVPNAVWYVNGIGNTWYLNVLDVQTSKSNATYVPNVNERLIGRYSHLAVGGTNRLGGSRAVPNGEVKTEGLASQAEAAATVPFFTYVAKDYVAVLRSGPDVGVIVQIFRKSDLQLTKSVQFDNLDCGWIIDAPSSQNDNYLLLMGSGTPYSWQTEAIDLQAGSVETRHSFI